MIIKDLSRIGRDLKRTIIVDNIATNFLEQRDNGIFISTWHDDASDTELKDLTALLKEIVVLGFDDVRVALRSYRDQVTRALSLGVPHPYRNLEVSK